MTTPPETEPNPDGPPAPPPHVAQMLDAVIVDRLGSPSSVSAVYLEESSDYRPIVTGDIFPGVRVSGSTESESQHELTMIVAHPCAMRKGPVLEERIRAASIVPVAGVSNKKWSRGHAGVFPLPTLAGVALRNGREVADESWGALLELAGPIATVELDVRQRVACLGPEGIHLLLQKLSLADTRVPVSEDVLAQVFAPTLDEVELLETWNEELVAPRVAAGADLMVELRAEQVEFDGFMRDSAARDVSVRMMLSDTGRRGEAHRLVAEEIRRRRN